MMHRPHTVRLVVLLAFSLLAMASPTLAGEPGAREFRPLVAAVHVHSSMSTGSLSLDELAQRAERLGIDAIVLAENFALRYEYGLPPLRAVLRAVITVPSVTAGEAGDFLNAVAAVQERHPRVLFVPGVEVAPHYYWTGSLLTGDLTMHNSQRNVLMIGLQRAEDYAALPSSGNLASHHYGWSTALNLSPALLFLPVLWMRARATRGAPREPRRRSSRAKHRMAWALLSAAVGFILLFNAWPFGQPAFSSYDDQLEYRPYQALIDEATKRGGLAIWSLTEARDHNTYSFGALGVVTVKTKPHPEALLGTDGYTGFGGLYQDTRHVADPGGIWDQLLSDYLTGQRASSPVLYGEIAFHRPGQAGIELDQVLNVLWVRDWSSQGVLDAMRAGRVYAVGQYRKGDGLRLDDFRVEAGGAGSRAAWSGETLQVADTADVVVRLSVSATDGHAHPVSVSLVRSGAVVAQVEGETPFTYRFLDPRRGDDEPFYFRAVVRGPGEIVSNPIFVVPEGTKL